ncbi:hypothetical protein C0033_20850 [Clostridium sp. chh4-2]|uniref:glycerophosphodiester phosphodiesterase family protein n=1 Tax=Clostridium sp. chh4-2 TaxID=2067550 RepID=UPI000CCDAB5D|nr:glycerophosphodiester phosphodiesterase family protein [Clostridium sp. chh4-2]PNV60108.1 hypothetical protein C0033_20850 [Clostridium sp. chh4-2]
MEDRIYRKQDLQHLKLIAHRGFTPEGPQNSLKAFEAAGKRGFWAIETDVRRTRDGVLVCCHDETIDSLYDGSGRICDADWKELSGRHFTEDRGERMPLFEEYLEICRSYGALPFIETKTMDVEEVVTAALRHFEEEELVISSILMEHLLTARDVSGGVFIHHIFSTPETVEILRHQGRCGVSYNYSDLSKVPEHLIEETHEKGVLVCLRAGDSPETVREMAGMGLDYIPTNRMTKEAMAQG